MRPERAIIIRATVIFLISMGFLLIASAPGQAHIVSSATEDFATFLNNILSADGNPFYVVVVMFFSFALGAIHVLSPGHGKTVISAYMVGTGGTVREAVILGVIVTVTHLSSVMILGIAIILASSYIEMERIMPVLGIFSGFIILAIGVSLFVGRIRKPDAFHQHRNHSHDHNPDDHHDHDHIHAKSRLSLLRLASLGVSGGIVPCYDAIVVLLLAFSLNRIILGLGIIGFFSLGLASVLIGLAILFAKTSSLLDRWTDQNRWIKRLPICSAALICVLGGLLAVQSILQIQ